MLFVAMSTPKKELFLHRHADVLAAVNFRMGVGGSFDVLAGRVRRAPAWMQKACLEWVYRFVQEPRDKWRSVVVESLRFPFCLIRHRLRRSAGSS